jgi:hypothetical protein
VIVVLVDEDDVDVALPQLLCSPDPTEATSEDEDARARGVAGGTSAHRTKHGRDVAQRLGHPKWVNRASTCLEPS